MADAPIIKIENVEKEYPAGDEITRVLQGISSEIYPGDYTIIYGASGSGKSTLLHHIVGLEVPTRGKIFVCGTDITKLKPEERAIFRARNFGMVYQFWYWAKSLSVWENVAMPLFIDRVEQKEAKAKAYEVLEEIGIQKYANKNPLQLSGGEQQRVCLARALINDPKIIIADEPTGNLDTHNADQVMQMLQELNIQKKRTVVMVTHNMTYLPFANRTIAIQDGKVADSQSKSIQRQINRELEGQK